MVTLCRHTSDVAVSVCILPTEFIGIAGKNVLESNVYRAVGTASKERVLRELLTTFDFLRESLVSFLFVFCGDVQEDVLDATNGKLGLHQIRPV